MQSRKSLFVLPSSEMLVLDKKAIVARSLDKMCVSVGVSGRTHARVQVPRANGRGRWSTSCRI